MSADEGRTRTWPDRVQWAMSSLAVFLLLLLAVSGAGFFGFCVAFIGLCMGTIVGPLFDDHDSSARPPQARL